MRVLFFGTSAFAVPTLQALHEAASRHTILAVVTQPDRPSGRGNKVTPPPVKERALALGYEVLQPEKVRRKPFPQTVRDLAPDVLVVVSFGQIIPQSVLDIPRFGGINVHASLLPRWRGAAPIHHAIIAGDSETGVATMQMEATLDTGPVFLEAREAIREDDTTQSLEPRLAALGGPLLVETLERLEASDLKPTPQTETGMVYASPVTRMDGLLNPEAENSQQLAQRIRGTFPRPGASLLLGDKLVKVLEARSLSDTTDTLKPGSLAVRRDGIAVGCANDTVLLLARVQPENRGPMNAADYARGARLTNEDKARVPTLTPTP